MNFDKKLETNFCPSNYHSVPKAETTKSLTSPLMDTNLKGKMHPLSDSLLNSQAINLPNKRINTGNLLNEAIENVKSVTNSSDGNQEESSPLDAALWKFVKEREGVVGKYYLFKLRPEFNSKNDPTKEKLNCKKNEIYPATEVDGEEIYSYLDKDLPGFKIISEGEELYIELPNLEELRYLLKEMGLDILIGSSEGIATDIDFIKLHLIYHAILSSGKEFIHDMLTHIARIIYRSKFQDTQDYLRKTQKLLSEHFALITLMQNLVNDPQGMLNPEQHRILKKHLDKWIFAVALNLDIFTANPNSDIFEMEECSIMQLFRESFNEEVKITPYVKKRFGLQTADDLKEINRFSQVLNFISGRKIYFDIQKKLEALGHQKTVVETEALLKPLYYSGKTKFVVEMLEMFPKESLENVVDVLLNSSKDFMIYAKLPKLQNLTMDEVDQIDMICKDQYYIYSQLLQIFDNVTPLKVAQTVSQAKHKWSLLALSETLKGLALQEILALEEKYSNKGGAFKEVFPLFPCNSIDEIFQALSEVKSTINFTNIAKAALKIKKDLSLSEVLELDQILKGKGSPFELFPNHHPKDVAIAQTKSLNVSRFISLAALFRRSNLSPDEILERVNNENQRR